jgi:hypothetical protein
MVVVEPSGNVDVNVTGTVVVERLSVGAGALAPASVLSVAPAVGAGELESASEVVYSMGMSAAGQVRGSKVRTASSVDDEVVEAVSVADAPDEVEVLESVETGIELAPEVVVVVMPASVDMVCPFVDVCVSVAPDEVMVLVSVAPDEVMILVSVETGIELAPEVVAMPASVEVVCPFVDV